MKISNFKVISVLVFMLFAVFAWNNDAIAQENTGKESDTRERVEAPDDNMAWPEYKSEIRVRYQRVMDRVESIRREAQEKKIDDPNFRKALVRFETRANEFMEKLKTADSIPAERQEKFRKQMKSELKGLNKAYERILNRWDTLKAEAK